MCIGRPGPGSGTTGHIYGSLDGFSQMSFHTGYTAYIVLPPIASELHPCMLSWARRMSCAGSGLRCVASQVPVFPHGL